VLCGGGLFALLVGVPLLGVSHIALLAALQQQHPPTHEQDCSFTGFTASAVASGGPLAFTGTTSFANNANSGRSIFGVTRGGALLLLAPSGSSQAVTVDGTASFVGNR
jgi:hypothetical protein